MKNVLLLGDSIRMGYEPCVRRKLEGRAEVFGPNENGRFALYTLNSLRFWINGIPKPDVIHWNNGLWDLGDDYHVGRPFSTAEEYRSALERTVVVMKKLFPEAKIIMATTTPTKNPDVSGMVRYNEILRSIAEENGFMVDDLFSVVYSDVEKYICPDGIHLTDEGWDATSDAVVRCIEEYLD